MQADDRIDNRRKKGKKRKSGRQLNTHTDKEKRDE